MSETSITNLNFDLNNLFKSKILLSLDNKNKVKSDIRVKNK